MKTTSIQLAAAAALSIAACSRSPSAPPTDRGRGALTEACPEAVKQAVAREIPGKVITGCKSEGAQFEVEVIDNNGAKMQIDMTPDGRVLQTETQIAVDEIPAAVMVAFAARYPGVKPARAEKQTGPGNTATYEIAFVTGGQAREATFAERGSFLEEE